MQTDAPARMRRYLARHPGQPVPAWLVAELLDAIELDRRRLQLAEGETTLAQLARRAGCTPDQLKEQLYAQP